jgi:large subunit ribosomal protein L3
MAGHFGDDRRTVQNLKVVKITPENNCLYVQGAIPGPISGYVIVRQAIKKRK